MTSSEPLIKIIPPNPVTHSILIVYCYTNNKTVQCQAKWNRVETFQYQQNAQNRNSRPPLGTQNGNTYKCTALDFNHVIQVQAICDYQGKQFRLVARSEPVKATKQILERKAKSQAIHGKISHANHEIQCSFVFESSESIQIRYGAKLFNLNIYVSNIVFLSTNSFKARIQSNRFEFMKFFHECSNQRQKTNHQLSLGNIFQFSFNSQIDKDMVLMKIAQISSLNKEKTEEVILRKPHMVISHQHIPLNSTENHLNGHVKIELKSREMSDIGDERTMKTKRSNLDGPKQQNYKKQGFFGFKTPDPKSANTVFYYNPLTSQTDKNQQSSVIKKNQKTKISQKITKKQPKQSSQDLSGQIYNEITIQEKTVLQKEPSIASNDKKKGKKAKEFLNIFDDEDQQAVSQPNIPFKGSSPQLYGLFPTKLRPITMHNQNPPVKSQGRQDLPSINLRGSFEQLDKFVQVPLNKKPKQKIKTQTCRQLSYQYPKTRQKTQLPNTPPNQPIQHFPEDVIQKQLTEIKRQNEQLKKENAQMRKQLEALTLLTKENNVLKKKYYQLSEEIGRLELERKEILADKLKWEASCHKERAENDGLRRELEEVTKILQAYMGKDQQLSLKGKQKHCIMTHHLGQASEDSRHKSTSQTLKFIHYPKKNYQPQSRDKTPPTKFTSHNQSLIEDNSKLNEVNSQSRKELRFPSFSYKYNSTNQQIVRP